MINNKKRNKSIIELLARRYQIIKMSREARDDVKLIHGLMIAGADVLKEDYKLSDDQLGEWAYKTVEKAREIFKINNNNHII